MAVQPSDIVAQMRAALLLSDPDLDTTVGTTTRKILDATGEVIGEAYADRFLLQYAYDVDSKSGTDLDDFVQLFGFSRLPARRGTGSITFERSSTAESETLIPLGTQVATDDTTPVVVQTLVPALMMRSDLSVTVPAQAVDGGSRGNIGANTLSRAITPVTGVGTFTNSVAFTGGSEAESDAQLRNRFKRTVFRSMAGTEQMFLGTALEDDAVTLVNVIGASKRHREQIEVIGGVATSTLVDPRYVYPGSAVFGESIDLGEIAIPDVQYTFDTSTRTVTIVGGALADGIYELEYEYVPQASRNNPPAGITNRVDIYVNGERPIEAVETAIFRTGRVFTNASGDPLNRVNFLRPSGAAPAVGNYLIDLAFGPVLDSSVDNTMTINGVTYTEGVHYFTVNDATREGGTSKSLSGLEFVSTANGNPLAIPANGTVFTANYVYNDVPGSVEESVRAWRLITTDVRVHQAKKNRLRMNMVLILDPGTTLSSIKPSIDAAISDHLNTVGFAGVVQVSDVLEAVTSVSGVDAARFATSTDNATNYAIQRVSETGSVLETYATGGRARDIILTDDTVPVFDSLSLTIRAQNSFGIV